MLGFRSIAGRGVRSAVGRAAYGVGAEDGQHAMEVMTKLATSDEYDFATTGRLAGTGRSSVSGVTATVFGATGFLGKYVVNSLGKIGSQVVVPYRGEELSWKHLKVMGDLGQIVGVPIDIRQPESLVHAMQGSNIVINLLGSEFNTRNFTLKEVHVDTPKLIAELAAEMGIRTIVHISALGANSTATSEWNQTKYDGECAVRESHPGAIILRSGPLFGPGDRFSGPLGHMLRKWPFMPYVNPKREIQPIYGPDMAEVVMSALTAPEANGKTYDVGGPVVYEEAQFLNELADMLLLEPAFVPIPGNLAVRMGRLMEKRLNVVVSEAMAARSVDGDEVNRAGVPSLPDLGVDTNSLRSFE
eukprot:CAMPEP_0119133962 /NCGR_PEP_ID=MMETSP1310-20130426/14778_1 /TAXON_ID=464262 /ORGANISM="Genus nov. species nov., Strain RCC2339" /LENGTH=357 /DNA_ID=CAMNT_0007124697 /DNA_START=69 /DNA_END=1139 /DNA_ORIENTATION=-